MSFHNNDITLQHKGGSREDRRYRKYGWFGVRNRTDRGQSRGVIDKSLFQNDMLYYFGEQIVLSNNEETRKKAPVDRQGRQRRVQL